MQRLSGILQSIQPISFLLIVAFASRHAHAEEPAAQFLEKLREHAHFDSALAYLESMKSSRLVTDEFKKTIPYEEGLILIQSSRIEKLSERREQILDDAQEKLTTFINRNRTHILASRANNRLGSVLIERARNQLQESKKPINSADKEDFLKKARQHYVSAGKIYDSAIETIKAKLLEMPKHIDPKEQEKIQLRDQLRSDYIQAQLVKATILYETADTAYTLDEKREILEQAASAYGEIHRKYRRRLAGLYALLNQGRCYQDLDEPQEALSYYVELLNQPSEPDEFRLLRTRALKLAVESWNHPKQKKYDLAIERAEPWVSKSRPAEKKDTDWLALRIQLAKSYKLQSDQFKKSDRNKRVYLSEARKLAQEVARQPSESRAFALNLLAQIGSAPKEEKEPELLETFASALEAGRVALSKVEQADTLKRIVQPRLAMTKNSQRKLEMQKSLDEADQQIETSRLEARRHFQNALRLADAQTPIKEVNSTRHFLSYLYYLQKDYYEAAVIGEFVTRKYPLSSVAPKCGNIAMASYMQLYQGDSSDSKPFLAERIVGLSDYLVEQWPDLPEATEALIRLIGFMVRQQRLDEAEQYLAKISENSPRRGEAEIQTGQALWQGYLRANLEMINWGDSPPAGVDLKSRKIQIESMKSRATRILENGIQRMKKAAVSTSLAEAVLSLAQIKVDTGKPTEAILLLEDKAIGAKTLVESNHPAISRSGYENEMYRTALRAYIASLSKARDTTAIMEKARDVMDTLNEANSGSEQGQQRLVLIYVGIARDLQQQMQLASEKDKETISQGFENFLDQVSQGTQKFNHLNWVAESFLSLGEGFNKGSGKKTLTALRYYNKSIEVFESILARAESDNEITPAVVRHIRMRLATAKRYMGRYKESIQELVSVLQEKNALLNVQIEAALAYQQWAGQKNQASHYLNAVKGAYRSKKSNKNIIWGWAKLSQITAAQISRGPEFREKYISSFHLSRYSQARCHYLYALRHPKGSPMQLKYLRYASDDIRLTANLYPAMGGPQQEKLYDNLLRKIQTRRGKQPLGLKAINNQSSRRLGKKL